MSLRFKEIAKADPAAAALLEAKSQQMYSATRVDTLDLDDAFLTVQPVTSDLYKAQYVASALPPQQMATGQQARAWITLKNAGVLPWYGQTNPVGNNPIRLGTTGDAANGSPFAMNGNGWLSNARIQMDPNTPSPVLPGQTATFSFTARAPAQTGSYTEHFDVVLEGNDPNLPNQWFGQDLWFQTTVSHYDPGVGSTRGGQFVDAYNRKGGAAQLGDASAPVGWYDTGAPDTLVSYQPFNDTSCCGSSFITHDEPEDSPPNSIPAFIVQGGILDNYRNRYGGPAGALGVPTSNEYNNGSSEAQNFAHGMIVWNNGKSHHRRLAVDIRWLAGAVLEPAERLYRPKCLRRPANLCARRGWSVYRP